MSLIQEALEKAGKPTADEVVETPKPAAKPAIPKAAPRPPEIGQATPKLSLLTSKPSTQTQKPAVKRRKGNSSIVWGLGVILLVGVAVSVFVLGADIVATMTGQLATPQEASRVLGETKSTPISVPAAEEAVSSSQKVVPFHLSGITSSGGERLALINNRVVGVGDLLPNRTTVERVESRHVILNYQGQEVRLNL